MATLIEMSDDEDSFEGPDCSKAAENCGVNDAFPLSSDEEKDTVMADDTVIISDDEDFPEVNLKNHAPELLPQSLRNDVITECTLTDDEDYAEVTIKKKAAIKSLFPSKNKNNNVKQNTVKALFSKKQNANYASVSEAKVAIPIEAPKKVFNRMIAGVNVLLPVDPYGSQVALMSKIITGIKKGENCILESPTGSGKTLALLCGALAWQQYEQNRLSQNQIQHYFTEYPELKKEGVAEYMGTPQDRKTHVTPEKLFSRTNFGEKSIYYKPEENGESSSSNQRQEKTPYREDFTDDSSCGSQVTIHKRARLGSLENTPPDGSRIPDDSKTPLLATPEKPINADAQNTPENVSLPTIYYGARTHTQLKQVIKEFKQTSYCGLAKMTLLSSRDKSCIREYDKNQWRTRNDMCRACIKSFAVPNQKERSNCLYYDNRSSLTHGSLPAAFDLEDLVEIAREKNACPYYGARALAKTAHIIFCPYNYLIDPSIRSSLSISLENNVVIIDEAHNIEGICRDAASVDITRAQIQSSIKELEQVVQYRFTNSNILPYVESLLKTLKDWDYWFENQTPLVNQQAVNNNEAVYKWQAEHFVNTLNNHNIGDKHYNTFRVNSENFCTRLREDPRTMLGVTQATGTLLESMSMGLGFLFRDNCQYIEDYKPALIRRVAGKNKQLSNNNAWRTSQFNEWVTEDSLTLSLICLNPAIVMQQLQRARCIAVASGTLTPLVSLHSELGTSFPHSVSPNHVIPPDRVWIGTLLGDAMGPQKYDAMGAGAGAARAALGRAVLRVCRLTPHGVLCFLPSYWLLDQLIATWQETGLWAELNNLKNVFCERRNGKDHDETMIDFYQAVETKKGALLFAVYRGKVSEGMDFKDRQARAVICVGVPYPNTYDTGVKAKMEYNNKYSRDRDLLPGREWLRVQAYRALNQAVGRCVRHRGDWGAVLLVDARYQTEYYTEHLSNWVKRFLGNNHHTYESLVDKPNGLAAFMQRMKIVQEEEDLADL